MKTILNVQYASLHGLYWSAYGVISSFASVYLLARGYSNGDIGMILALGNVLAVVLQPLLADLADRARRISIFGVLEISTVALMLLTVGTYVLQGKSLALTCLYILLMGWHTALQPLLNALAFKLEESGVHINFGICRSMGSLAYSIVCAVLGRVVSRYGEGILPLTDEVILALLIVSLLLIAGSFRKGRAQRQKLHTGGAEDEELAATAEEKEEIEQITLLQFVKRNQLFFVMNVGVMCVFFTNAVLNNFMLQIITPLGGDSEDLGQILSLMAFLEIPMLVGFDWVNRRFSCQLLLKVASVTYLLKIVTTWLAPSVGVILFSQVFQLTSFALFLPAIVRFIDQIMAKGEAVKGQALYTIMVTAASVISSLVGGIILDVSTEKMLLLASTLFTAIGAVIIFLTVDRIKTRK